MITALTILVWDKIKDFSEEAQENDAFMIFMTSLFAITLSLAIAEDIALTLWLLNI